MDYFIDGTLLNYQLISLNKLDNDSFVKLKMNTNIKVIVQCGNQSYSFEDCHIDNTEEKRLRIPLPVIIWIKENFPVSVAYFAANADKKAPGIWKKKDKAQFYKVLKTNKGKLDIPAETLNISLAQDTNRVNYILIKEGFKITCANAEQYLSSKALCSILPYIISGVQNTSLKSVSHNEGKAYIIDQTTKWLSVSDYSATPFNHPGLYILRRKCDDEKYAYYIGKAADIKARVTQNNGKLSHPEEKFSEEKWYDEIACISINFDDILKSYGLLTDENKTANNNPPVSKGSHVDNALYAVEDIAIHIAAMIMLSEGKRLDNKQYREYTSEHICKF